MVFDIEYNFISRPFPIYISHFNNVNNYIQSNLIISISEIGDLLISHCAPFKGRMGFKVFIKYSLGLKESNFYNFNQKEFKFN